MRYLTQNELGLISGGTGMDSHSFSDTFISGMKGEDISDKLTYSMMAVGICAGVFMGGMIGFMTHSILNGMAGLIGGAAFGSGIGYLGTTFEYHRGQNYVTAMQIMNS